MKKIWAINLCKLLGVFLIVLGSLGFLECSAEVYEYQKNSTTTLRSITFNALNKYNGFSSKVEKAKKEKEIVSKTTYVRKTVSHNESTISGNSIYIPGVLNKPLLKDNTGENLYLSHNINGVYDGVGVPYIDFRTNLTDRKTIIYAHSSMNGNGPFQALQNYHYNKGYYDNHRYININYNGQTYTYLIFSVYVSLADNEESEGLEYFHNTYYDDNEWNEAINRYKSHSEYDTGVNVSSNDKILILQTCSMDRNYYEKYYRYNLLIMGKLV